MDSRLPPAPDSLADADTRIRHQPSEAATVPTGGGIMDQDASPLSAPGRVLAGRYTVLDVLGQGGMGVVLAAYDARLDRRVALKLVRGQLGGSQPFQDRLLREAQAMARLNHPHVVHVYDAGTLEDGPLFIAMEYVEGQTLRQWLAQQPRSWREVLEAYLAAGRGLAAAHAAGLIHRDFKPDNVLVGNDGRARVTDFGLARAGPAAKAQAPVPPPPGSPEFPGTGIAGTPRYMAPEILQGTSADVRTDLFAFCVSLYEGLYRQLPFAEDGSPLPLRPTTDAGAAGSPQSEVPAWVARTVRAGLSIDPAARPASMEALLAALEDDPAVKRRARLRAVALACVGVGLVALAAWGWTRQQGPGCAHMDKKLAGIWDASIKEKVKQGLVGTGVSYAAISSERVAAALDAYASGWVKLRTEVCEAGQQEAANPRSLAVLQEYCLERRRSELAALTELLSRNPDPPLVSRAVQAAQSLPPLAYCADARALLAAVPPPEAPEIRTQAERLQQQVDRLHAMLETGKFREGLAESDGVLHQAEALGYAPLHARALYTVAALQEMVGDYTGAEQRVRQAILAAARGKDLVQEAQAWTLLGFVVGAREHRLQEAEVLEPAVEAATEIADDDLVRALALNNLAVTRELAGKYEEARVKHESALALREKALGPEHPLVARSLNNLSGVLEQLGRDDEARAQLERGAAILEKALGPENPEVAISLGNLAFVLQNLGRYDEARAKYERALAAQEKVLGPEHPNVANVLLDFGNALEETGHYEEAKARYERALAVWRKIAGPDDPAQVGALINLSSVLERLSRVREARAMCERALVLQEAELGPDHPELADTLVILARVLMSQKKYDEAGRRLERALAIQEKALGSRSPHLTHSLMGLGDLLLTRHQPDKAATPLERALALARVKDRADVQLSLARALWESKRDRPRAVALAREAQEFYRRVGHTPKLAESSRWLAEHPRP